MTNKELANLLLKTPNNQVNFLISNSLYLTQIKEVKINENETTLQLSK